MKRHYGVVVNLDCIYLETFSLRNMYFCFSGCCKILTFPQMRSIVLPHNEELSLSFIQGISLNLWLFKIFLREQFLYVLKGWLESRYPFLKWNQMFLRVGNFLALFFTITYFITAIWPGTSIMATNVHKILCCGLHVSLPLKLYHCSTVITCVLWHDKVNDHFDHVFYAIKCLISNTDSILHCTVNSGIDHLCSCY
jgi:hypothetical protein